MDRRTDNMLIEHQKSKNFNPTMPKTVYNSSTPIKPNFDPVSKNSSASADCTMNYEKIYPGIYLTSVKDLCAPDDLKIYGFTHIIYIDKHHIIARNNGQPNHIGSSHGKCDAQNQNQHRQSQGQQNRHKHGGDNGDDDDDCDRRNENVIKGLGTSVTASITIRQAADGTSMLTSTNCCRGNRSGSSNCDNNDTMINRSLCATNMKVQDNGSSAGCSTSTMSFAHEMPIDDEPTTNTTTTTPSAAAASASSLLHSKHYPSNENLFGHSDFATLDLNFGESTYFTANVLPNCYKAVAFIENALKNNGAVLVIDCIGEHQKCVTIVIGFLMYKYNKNFLTAYQLIKRLHPNIELDKFFTTQLYEYEPILQVQRSQSAGNSCSREMRSALLKRKKSFDDCYYYQSDTMMTPALLPHNPFICATPDNFVNNIEQTTETLMEQ